MYVNSLRQAPPRAAAAAAPAISIFPAERGVKEDEPGMRPRNDTSALRRHVPLPGTPRRSAAAVLMQIDEKWASGTTCIRREVDDG